MPPGAAGIATYTYLVPDALADLELGEAVLVEFGRRQALGIIVAEASELPASGAKPIVDRVRADGPLLPGLTLALASGIARHYLAPPALVLRAMLPPGLLERLELVAELTPAGATAGDATSGAGEDAAGARATADLLAQLARGPRPVRDLAGPDGRAGLLRRLRALEAEGRVSLGWTLLGAGAGPRYERWIRLLDAGRAAVAALAAGESLPGRPLGPRQVESAGRARGGTGRGTARGRAGRPSRTDRRCRARPTRPGRGRGPRAPAPTTGEATGRQAWRPSRRERPPARPGRGGRPDRGRHRRPGPAPAPARWRDRRRQDRDLRRGDRRLARSRAAGPRARAGDRPRPPARRPVAGRPRRPGRARPFRARGRGALRRVATDPRRRRRHRGRDASGRGRAAGRCRGRSSSTRSTTPRTRATGRRGSRRATSRSAWPSWRVPRSCSGRRRPRSRASAAPGAATTTGSSCRLVRSAPPRPSRSSTCAPSWPPASAASCRAR